MRTSPIRVRWAKGEGNLIQDTKKHEIAEKCVTTALQQIISDIDHKIKTPTIMKKVTAILIFIKMNF